MFVTVFVTPSFLCYMCTILVTIPTMSPACPHGCPGLSRAMRQERKNYFKIYQLLIRSLMIAVFQFNLLSKANKKRLEALENNFFNLQSFFLFIFIVRTFVTPPIPTENPEKPRKTLENPGKPRKTPEKSGKFW